VRIPVPGNHYPSWVSPARSSREDPATSGPRTGSNRCPILQIGPGSLLDTVVRHNSQRINVNIAQKNIKKYTINIKKQSKSIPLKMVSIRAELDVETMVCAASEHRAQADRASRNLPIGRSGTIPISGLPLARGPLKIEFVANGTRSGIRHPGGVSLRRLPCVLLIFSPNRVISARFGPSGAKRNTTMHSGPQLDCRSYSLHIYRQVLHENKSR
jgi:hypothetical protein